MKINFEIGGIVPVVGTRIAKSHIYKQGWTSFASCLFAFNSGVVYGISAVMLPQLRKDKDFNYDGSYDSWIASSAILAMTIGSLASGPVLDSFGRKASHIILGIPFIIGWIFVACANSIIIILVGRVITGLTSGAIKAVPYVYIGEITSPNFRTSALFLPVLMSDVGILFSHIVGHYLTWHISAIVFIVLDIISCIACLFVKESPLWLIAKGKTEEGIALFRWFRGTDEESEAELQLIIQRQTEKPNISVKETVHAICSMSFAKPMIISLILMTAVQLSGVNILIFYCQDIFDRAFSQQVDAFTLTIVTGSIRTISAICLVFVGNKFPKKIMFLVNIFGSSIFTIGLAICFLMHIENVWMPVLCLVVYIAFSSAIVIIGWTYAPELLPNNARGFGTGMNSAYSLLLLFIIIKVTPQFTKAFGEAVLFGSCGIATIILGFVIILILPETSGRTLQSIEDTYNKSKATV